MVVIRLSRAGSKKRPYYNIVVADKTSPRDGRFIERVGFSNPMASQNEVALRVDVARVEFWEKRGAQTSPTVRRLVRRFRKHGEAIIPNPSRPSKVKRAKTQAASPLEPAPAGESAETAPAAAEAAPAAAEAAPAPAPAPEAEEKSGDSAS